MSKKIIIDLLKKNCGGKSLFGKEAILAGIRYQYLSYNNIQLEASKDFLEGHNRNTHGKSVSLDSLLDLESEEHLAIIKAAVIAREVNKFECQELTRRVDPDKSREVDVRQMEMYHSTTIDPRLDPEKFFERIDDKFKKKFSGKKIGEIIKKAFSAGGRDIVPPQIADFAEKAFKSELEAKNTLGEVSCENVIDAAKDSQILKIDPETAVPMLKLDFDIVTEMEKSYKEQYLNEVLKNLDLKDSVDSIITEKANSLLPDIIKTIDDITPENIEVIRQKILKDTQYPISGIVGNALSAASGITDLSVKVFLSVMNELQEALVQKYTLATTNLAIDSVIQDFKKDHMDEVQSEVAKLSDIASTTTSEREAKQKQLQELQNNPDHLSHDQLEELKKQLQQDIDVKTKELKETQEHIDIFDDDKSKARYTEYKKEQREAWHEGGDRSKVAFFESNIKALDTKDMQSISGDNIKELDGNFIDAIANYLKQNIGATKTDEASNNIDALYQEYTTTNTVSKVTILLVDEIFGYVTVISSDDKTLINNIISNLLPSYAVSLAGEIDHSSAPQHTESAQHFSCCAIL